MWQVSYDHYINTDILITRHCVFHLHITSLTDPGSQGGIAPNQVIARSEFEVHRQIYME